MTHEETVAAMVEAIVRFVDERDHVTFAELDTVIPGFSGGYECLRLGGQPDYLWFNMTLAGAEAVQAVMSGRRVAVAACSPFAYLLDGRVPNVPVSESLRPHKKDKWVPVCLRPARFGNVALSNGILFYDPPKQRPKRAKKPA